MDEPSDDILTRPLGVPSGEEPQAPRGWRAALDAATSPVWRGAGFAGCGLLALLVAVPALIGDPRGGEPRAAAVIAIREEPPAPPARAESAPIVAAAPDAPTRSTALHSTASEIERASGVIVTRPAGSAAEQAVIVRVPPPDPVRLALAPDPRVSERGRHGVLPRVGEGRLRALDVYARPDDGSGSARIALLISGVGIGQAATAAAIARLPPPISLALSPYAADLEKTASRAREAGHELLVQVPMEPFDYPDSDPGPQTLLAAARAPENLDRLSWTISRFPGLVGVVNFMGGKLLADPAALEPVLKEVGSRGLGFVDDGTAQGSQALAATRRTGTPAARAEIVIDAVARPEAIDRELARAEVQARKAGFVLVSASAQQLSIDRIARWARDLDARGIRLVPVSTALRGASTSASARMSSAEH